MPVILLCKTNKIVLITSSTTHTFIDIKIIVILMCPYMFSIQLQPATEDSHVTGEMCACR